MVTKFDIEQENKKIRAMREENIKQLSEALQEAQDVYAVMPIGNDLESTRERATVRNQIKHIRELLNDEQRAIESISEASEAQVGAVVERLW